MSTEDDVARVLAVTEALEGPQRVWVVSCVDIPNYGSRYDLTIWIAATETRARQGWKKVARDKASHALIDKGLFSFTDHEGYWLLEEKEVHR